MTLQEPWCRALGERCYSDEVERLTDRGFRPIECSRSDVIGAWEGTISVLVLAEGPTQDVTIRLFYRAGYPWTKPHCVPVRPGYSRCQHQQPDDLPKSDWPNRLCIWEDSGPGWHPSYTLAAIIQHVAEWVRATELGWHTRSREEAWILDPERYFRHCDSRLVLFPEGLGAMLNGWGHLDLVDAPAHSIATSIDGIGQRTPDAVRKALRMEAATAPRRVPYVLLCRQPSCPLFGNLSTMVKELEAQGHPKGTVLRNLERFLKPWASHGELCLVYETGMQRVACLLRFRLAALVNGQSGLPIPFPSAALMASDARFSARPVRSLDSDCLLLRNPRQMRNDQLRNSRYCQ